MVATTLYPIFCIHVLVVLFVSLMYSCAFWDFLLNSEYSLNCAMQYVVYLLYTNKDYSQFLLFFWVENESYYYWKYIERTMLCLLNSNYSLSSVMQYDVHLTYTNKNYSHFHLFFWMRPISYIIYNWQSSDIH